MHYPEAKHKAYGDCRQIVDYRLRAVKVSLSNYQSRFQLALDGIPSPKRLVKDLHRNVQNMNFKRWILLMMLCVSTACRGLNPRNMSCGIKHRSKPSRCH